MIPVVDAYGEYEEESVIELPKNIFMIDGQFDDEKVFPGAIVPLVDNEGNRINAEIVEVKAEVVKVDLNHPLAGEDLYFSGRIISVTQPTEEELHAMMHHGCGGGCSCDSCGEGGCSGCGGGCC
jgi:FKBP-type peptidyl-prolyl cis-trans isomerase SlyD